MSIQTWTIYLIAAIGLSLTPGPNSLLALTHGALYGYRMTLYTVLGGAIGFVTLIGLSLLGIGALLQASPAALTLLKWIGGGYLVWLGLQLWRAPVMTIHSRQANAAGTGISLFQQGLLAAVSNPKALLFFGAFLPQFLDAGRGLLGQFLVMAATFALVEILVEVLIARLAHKVRPMLQRHGLRVNRMFAGMFMLMGIALPITR